MNYYILDNKLPLSSYIAVVDNINLFSIGILCRYQVKSRITGVASKPDEEKFQIMILKIKKKDLETFKLAMEELDYINATLYGEDYLKFRNNLRKELEYELYKAEYDVST